MNENLVSEVFITIAADIYREERTLKKSKPALFLPKPTYIRHDITTELHERRRLFYPPVKMPIQPTGYIKAKEYDCL